jgi:protein TonB
MISAYLGPSPDQDRASLRKRAAIIALVIAGHLLVLFLVILPGPPLPRPLQTEPKIFEVRSYAEQMAPKPAARMRKSASGGERRTPVTVAAPKTPPPAVRQSPLKMMILTREEFAAADIAKLPSHSGDSAPGDNTGKDSGNADGDGQGPGGERLYNAEWYKRPTDAEMAFYLPHGGAPPGWGMIACRTIPNYRVEDCRELGESPGGSGLARAVRQAAWQFRVLPPRIGGRPMIGAWVSIRFDFHVETK